MDSLPALELGAEQDPHQTSSDDTVSEVDASPEFDSDQNPQASTDQPSDQATTSWNLAWAAAAVIVSLLHSLPLATGVGVDVEDDCLALALGFPTHAHGVGGSTHIATA